LGKSASINPETVMDCKSKQLPKIINKYQTKDTFNADKTGHFYNPQPSKTQTDKGDSCHGKTKPKQTVTVLLSCNSDGTGDSQAHQTLPKLPMPHKMLTQACTTQKPSCFQAV
jgi:hypothetical protein